MDVKIRIIGASGGNRTLTLKKNWILNPARLPVPPQRQYLKDSFLNKPLNNSENEI
jgi:hypothetical protein